MSIYTELKTAGVSVSSHESDLYAKVTPESEALIARYQFKINVKRFRSQIDGTPWFDIPFAYDPYWEKHYPQTA
jgi:hypothetical protein